MKQTMVESCHAFVLKYITVNTSTSTKKWPMSERLRKTLCRRCSQLRRQTASLSTFSYWPSKTLCLPSSCYQTNSVRVTPCRLACWKTAPTSLRRSLWRFLTSLYGQ